VSDTEIFEYVARNADGEVLIRSSKDEDPKYPASQRARTRGHWALGCGGGGSSSWTIGPISLPASDQPGNQPPKPEQGSVCGQEDGADKQGLAPAHAVEHQG
jgi:hypothetical protein